MDKLSPILSFRQVQLSVAKNILSIPDFNISVGERIVITGSSGKGKTTFLKSLLGFHAIHSGSIYFSGLRLNDQQIKHLRQHVFWMPQELSFSGNILTFVKDIFQYQNNKSNIFNKQKLHRLLTLFDLPTDILSKDFQNISVGEKQRILFCIMLLLNKTLNLIDEPFTGLDEKLKIKATEYLFKQTSMTVLAVSHDPLWRQYADNTIII